MTASTGRLRIGTSGYHYEHWKGIFYPEDLPKSRWFAHYARTFDTLEINNTFYRLPSAAAFDGWKAQAPPDFCYALKFSRYGTHILRLKKPRATIRRFVTLAKRLGSLLGPILIQLPPRWKVNAARLDGFLGAAPRDCRWAVEFRDPSWLCRDIFNVLKRHDAALCIHDMLDDHPRILTTSWTYLRYHGDRYAGSYSRRALSDEARWIGRQLRAGIDVFAYFNNDAQGYAVKNAIELRRLLATARPFRAKN